MLLSFAGLYFFFESLSTIPTVFDFIKIILTNTNIDKNYGWVGILMSMWDPIALFFITYIALELLFPHKKWSILSTFIVLGTVYEFLLFFDMDNFFTIYYPPISGELTIGIIYGLEWGILVSLLGFYFFIFNGLGLAFKAFKSKGLIRKKYTFLSSGFLILILCGNVNSYLPLEGQVIWQLITISISSWLLYKGFTPQKQVKLKKKKIPSTKEVQFTSYMLGKPSIKEDIDVELVKNLGIDKKLLIFMSYATKDVDMFKIHKLAKYLVELTEIENVLFWEKHMEDNIFEYMDDNLGKCDVMVLFCSKNALNSVPVKKEWTAAEAIGKPIIPVFYDVNHIPTLLKSRLGIEYDFYDMEKNILGLRNLILKKVTGISD
jgi:hypothetical protein